MDTKRMALVGKWVSSPPVVSERFLNPLSLLPLCREISRFQRFSNTASFSPTHFLTNAKRILISGVFMMNQETLMNCGVELQTMSGSPHFSEHDTKARVRVKLDSSLSEGVYLTVFAYPGNAQFDADASVNKRLFTEKAFDGSSLEITFSKNALPISPGYRIVACLNVPVAEDFYLPVISNAMDVLDESGRGIPQYEWPHIAIVEKSLHAGDEYAHFDFTADERLLSSENVTVSYCVYAYPASEKFDLEEPYMISLASKIDIKDAFENRRIPFSEKVKSGYKVRAVAYWSQCSEEFVPKGNDYEFGQPDNSVTVI